MLEELFRDLVAQADGDARVLHTALTEMFPAMPTALREAVVEFAVARPDPIFAQLGCYWLVDPSAPSGVLRRGDWPRDWRAVI